MRIEVQWFEGCPHAEAAWVVAREVAAKLAPLADVVELVIRDDAHALEVNFQGSPSILVDGRDLEGRDEPSQGLACRLYPGGPIPASLVEDAIRRALGETSVEEGPRPPAGVGCDCCGGGETVE